MALSEPTSPFTGPSEPVEQNGRIWHRFSKWFGRDESPSLSHEKDNQMRPSLSRRLSRKVVPGLPRPPTFKRQNSEKRDRLFLVSESGDQRRAQSLDRRRARSLLPFSSTNYELASMPAPGFYENQRSLDGASPPPVESPIESIQPQIRPMPPSTPPTEPDQFPDHHLAPLHNNATDGFAEQLDHELEDRWILNLSMHFRDNSPREKFFVTYAETPTRWRRVTVSCDYRDAHPESLEQDLQGLKYQRDKNLRIYEAIRNSLPDIQFYDTVTNLRLETGQDDRLHVHVTEDVNEIIQYPSTRAVKHLQYARVDERDVAFDSHLSGFVYKVRVNDEAFEGRVCVKKEIPGPDSVEEFLYEINVLNALVGTSNIVQFEGLVVDEENDQVKGLLISYANQGPLVDIIFDFKKTGALSWERKAKWAKQMIYGLSAIHESGFVQGDCTLSNIVIDERDDALIIDVNRRGCPVGWEPPEIQNMVDSGHRISMYIGTKSDLFQLGMSLWALIWEEDQPERQLRPLTFSKLRDVPDSKKFLLDVAKICLSEKPKDRLSAEKLLSFFPKEQSPYPALLQAHKGSEQISMNQVTDRDTVYLDPSSLVEEVVPTRHTHQVSDASISNSRSKYPETDSTDNVRGRTLPRGLTYLSRDSTLDVEPLVVSVSPGRDSRYSGHLYGFELDENDEEAAQEVIRRRHRIKTQITTSQDKDLVDLGDVMRDLAHTDSGLDMDMQNEAQISPKVIKMLDHIDSGFEDMEHVLLNSNDLARRKIDLKDIDEDVTMEIRTKTTTMEVSLADQSPTQMGRT